MTTRGKEVHKVDTGTSQGKTEADLFDLLRHDHAKARDLFARIDKTSKKEIETRQEAFSNLEQELLIHMEAEERFLYTALEQHLESREKALEKYEEHLVARTIIGAFISLAVDDERWAAKLKVLRELIGRHMDEEERELFKVASQVLNREQLQGISAKVQELKREARKGQGKEPSGKA
jgi:hemerythrin-like domain-containing protein